MGSRVARTTWIAAGACLAVASLGWGTFQATSLLAFDRRHFTESFTPAQTGPITTIDVDNAAGSIEIVGSDRDDIVIDGEIERGIKKPTHSERVADGTLRLEADCFAMSTICSVDYDVQVPRDIAVKVRAAGGSVRVTNMTGAQDLDSSGGGLRVEAASGDLRLRSSGGGVTAIGLRSARVDASASGGGVRLEFVDEPQAVNASSSGGGVTVVVPDTPVAYDIDAASSGGGAHRDVRSDPNSNRTIRVRSSGGGVTVRYPAGP
jgi:hypothetical protein